MGARPWRAPRGPSRCRATMALRGHLGSRVVPPFSRPFPILSSCFVAPGSAFLSQGVLGTPKESPPQMPPSRPLRGHLFLAAGGPLWVGGGNSRWRGGRSMSAPRTPIRAVCCGMPVCCWRARGSAAPLPLPRSPPPPAALCTIRPHARARVARAPARSDTPAPAARAHSRAHTERHTLSLSHTR